MSAIVKISHGDDEVYEAVDANLAAGVFVVPSNTATQSGNQGINASGDAAKNVVGVTAKSTVTAANQDADAQANSVDGYPAIYVGGVSPLTTVYSHAIVEVTYTAAAVAFGAKVAAAANGEARAWVTADGADAIVGTCAQVGGVSAAGGTARVKVRV